ncbi:MAG: division/cell wall cluster transcriptional repressor MraZ [Clostridiales bacterium]|nr:division/cell wall cluster transcriptional repressor MraZ [Clostridiales bacterium]
MLKGEFQHNIDAKGRMIMPAKFRDALGDCFVATKGLDKCIFVFPLPEWEALDTKLSELSLSKGREIQRFFYGGMTRCEIDKQGRILIPANLREYAGLEKDVAVIGLTKRAEIWSKANWDLQNEKFIQNTDAVALQMEDLGI